MLYWGRKRDANPIEIWSKQEGRAAQTIEHGIIQLRGCWEYCKRLGYSVNDVVFPKIKVNNKRVRCLS